MFNKQKKLKKNPENPLKNKKIKKMSKNCHKIRKYGLIQKNLK